MPSSKRVSFERVRNGARDEMFAVDLPADLEVRVVKSGPDEPDHEHHVFGTKQELDDLGVKATPPKRVRKPAAKKSTAKRPAKK